MFTKAIVRTPSRNIADGLTTANLGIPNYTLALNQHENYIDALNLCGLEVIILEPDDKFPDSTFVEDTAILTPHCAIITNPGAHSRKGEIIEISNVLSDFYTDVETIDYPGTLDGGDVVMVGKHFYIGLSERTSENGAEQLISILEKYGMTGSTLKINNTLHLKSAVSYLEYDNLLATGDFLNEPELQKFKSIGVDSNESYAANSVWINDRVLVPKGFSKTKRKIEAAGYSTIAVDVSEFQKMDGGLSCLSLRF
jgi:dimethylargininase